MLSPDMARAHLLGLSAARNCPASCTSSRWPSRWGFILVFHFRCCISSARLCALREPLSTLPSTWQQPEVGDMPRLLIVGH